MKNKAVSISLIALSTFVLMLIAFVPHHHHEGTACVIMEHTHHDDIPENNNSQSCIAEADYLTRSFNGGVRCKIINYDNHNHEFLFPVYFYVADFISSTEQSSSIEYGEYHSFYKTAEANQFNGLRAPPHSIS